MYHEQFDDDDLLNNMGNLAQTKEKNQVFRKRATRLGTLTPAKAEMMRINDKKKSMGSLGNKGKAAELDMDHVFVKFTDFLWAMTIHCTLLVLVMDTWCNSTLGTSDSGQDRSHLSQV